MNPDGPPPSFSSAAKITSNPENLDEDQTNQRSIINSGFVDGPPPVMSFSGRQTNSFNQPPSQGDVRQLGVSNPSGSNDPYAYGQRPPSLNDVGGRRGSQTGPPSTGNSAAPGGNEGEPGMSLTASGFKTFFPNAFRKDSS